MILIGLHYTLVPCYSFKGFALPPSLLFHALFLSPIQTHKFASTIFWRDNQKIVGLGREILYNIQLPNPSQYWSHWRSWGCPNSSPGVPGGHHALTCLWIGLRKVVTPQPVRGSSSPRGPRRSSCLDLPRDSISRRLSCLSLSGDLHPDLGTPGSQVAIVLGRMNLHHIYSCPRWAN